MPEIKGFIEKWTADDPTWTEEAMKLYVADLEGLLVEAKREVLRDIHRLSREAADCPAFALKVGEYAGEFDRQHRQ